MNPRRRVTPSWVAVLLGGIAVAATIAYCRPLVDPTQVTPTPTPTIRVIVLPTETPAAVTPTLAPTLTPTLVREPLVEITATTRQPTATPTPTSTPEPTGTPAPTRTVAIQQG